jgi:outer membrane protein assembly factor BamA
VAPNLYFKDELYHLKLTMVGALWPANYYGIGNDTHKDNKEKYESTSFSALLLFERKFKDKIYFGTNYLISYKELNIEEGGALESNEIIGVEDGLNSGPGIAVTFDTRDNENDARNGTFLNLRSNWFRPAFGSDFTFAKYEIFLGHYIPIANVTGLALGSQINLTRGDIPFTELNSPDGVRILRGIENGRYRDRDMVALQVEYRFPISNRWGAALFAETAQVAHEIDDLTMNGWKYSLGTGIRYALNPSERFNLRLDVSFVDDGFGLVLNIREAF